MYMWVIFHQVIREAYIWWIDASIVKFTIIADSYVTTTKTTTHERTSGNDYAPLTAIFVTVLYCCDPYRDYTETNGIVNKKRTHAAMNNEINNIT